MKQLLGLVFCGLFYLSLQDVNAVLLPAIFLGCAIYCFGVLKWLLFNMPVTGLLVIGASIWMGYYSAFQAHNYGASFCSLGGILVGIAVIFTGKNIVK